MAGEFHWFDYVLFVATLALSAAIGVWAAVSGGGQKTTEKFLMGNRNLSFFPVTMSIFMSFISAILILGNTAEMYMFGVQYYVSLLGSIIAYFYIASVLVPLFYELKLTSTFEYLEKRYNSKAVRVLGNIFFILSFSTYMGIATFAPATALEGAIGFPVWASIIIEGVLATFYTSIGGMKAVVWTDAIQGIIYLGGVITVLTVGIIEVGGISEVFRVADAGGRLNTFSFNMNPGGQRMTVWSNVIGSAVISLETIGIGQASVQRYCSLNSLKKARLSIIANAPALIIMYTLTCLIGLVVYAYYTQQGCDPLRDGTISDPNQLLSTFIMDVVDFPGVPGLFLAVLFAGALSTLSSGLSALAAVTWKDILELRFKDVSEVGKTRITKGLTLMYGVISLGVAFAVQYLPVHVSQAASSLITAASSPLLGMFLLGLFFPWANKYGAIIGSLIASSFLYWISIGSSIEQPYVSYMDTVVENCTNNVTDIASDPDDILDLYRLGYQWYSPLAVLIVIAFGIPISFLTGATDPKKLDPRYVSPFFDRLLPCLPRSLREKLWCGVPQDRLDEFNDDKGQDQSSSQMRIGNGTVSTIDISKETPNGRSFKYLDQNGKLTINSGDFEPIEIPAADYGSVNPVFTDDTDGNIDVNYYSVRDSIAKDYNRGLEVTFPGVNGDLKQNDDEPKYQTPPYDTFGYGAASSPRRMYAHNPIYSVIQPRPRDSVKEQKEGDETLKPGPSFDSYGYHRGSSPRDMYAKEFGFTNEGFDC